MGANEHGHDAAVALTFGQPGGGVGDAVEVVGGKLAGADGDREREAPVAGDGEVAERLGRGVEAVADRPARFGEPVDLGAERVPAAFARVASGEAARDDRDGGGRCEDDRRAEVEREQREQRPGGQQADHQGPEAGGGRAAADAGDRGEGLHVHLLRGLVGGLVAGARGAAHAAGDERVRG